VGREAAEQAVCFEEMGVIVLGIGCASEVGEGWGGERI